MRSNCVVVSVSCASSSAKYGTHFFVVASHSTIGTVELERTPAIEQSDSPMLVEVAMFELVRERLGTLIMTTEPGEKPSFWFWYLGLMCTPFTFSGVDVAEKCTSSPVG